MVGSFAVMANRLFKTVYLKEWREHAELTQVQLAELLGVKDITVSRWERGERDLDTKGLGLIAAALSKKIKPPLRPSDLFRHPRTLSLDSMLHGASEAKIKQVAAIIKAYNETDGGEK